MTKNGERRKRQQSRGILLSLLWDLGEVSKLSPPQVHVVSLCHAFSVIVDCTPKSSDKTNPSSLMLLYDKHFVKIIGKTINFVFN